MRRIDGNKQFKACYSNDKKNFVLMFLQGSVFVEFADMKSVEVFLHADPKLSWDGAELLIMSKCELLPLPTSFL